MISSGGRSTSQKSAPDKDLPHKTLRKPYLWLSRGAVYDEVSQWDDEFDNPGWQAVEIIATSCTPAYDETRTTLVHFFEYMPLGNRHANDEEDIFMPLQA